MSRGGLRPSEFIDVGALANRLGISRTPLRDALLQLQVEGFITILPRRGFQVRPLALEDIRQIYEILGALESVAVASVAPHLAPDDLRLLGELNGAMARAIAENDFDRYYERNLAFHDVFLSGCGNPRLASMARTLKQRLYDWPRRKGFVRAWEERSVEEHAELIRLIERREAEAAAGHVRNVHWSFPVQERFVREYYFASQAAASEGRA
jgi:DNA-binding GntR family transcriptional regulator